MLPPESFSIGAAGPGERIPIFGDLVERRGFDPSEHQETSLAGERRQVIVPERQIVTETHPSDAGILQRQLGDDIHAEHAQLFPRSVEHRARDANCALVVRMNARKNLHQLALSVSGNSSDAQNLAARQCEIQFVEPPSAVRVEY